MDYYNLGLEQDNIFTFYFRAGIDNRQTKGKYYNGIGLLKYSTLIESKPLNRIVVVHII